MVNCKPSAADLWAVCAGSALASKLTPPRQTDEKEKGIQAHRVAQAALTEWLYFDSVSELPDELDADQREAVAMYVHDVISRLAEKDVVNCGPKTNLMIETTLAAPWLQGQNLIIDSSYASRDRGLVILWEFKSGRRPVKAESSWQLIANLWAVIEHLGINGLGDQHLRVELRVVQPLAYDGDRVSVYSGYASDFRGAFNILKDQAELAQRENPPTCSGEQCYNCPALSRCGTARFMLERIISYTGELNLLDLTLEQQAANAERLAPAIKVLEKAVEGMRNTAITALENGQVVNGFGLENGRGRSVYAVTDDVVIQTLDLYGINAAKPPAAKPIGEIKPLVKAAGLDFDELQLTKYVQGPLKLVRIENTQGFKAFGQQTKG